MADEWVQMTHPVVGDADKPVTRESFDLVWSKNGWELKGTTSAPESRLARNKPEGEK